MNTKLLQTYVKDTYDIQIKKVDFDSHGNTIIQTKNQGTIKVPYIPGTKFTDRLRDELNAFKLLGII